MPRGNQIMLVIVGILAATMIVHSQATRSQSSEPLPTMDRPMIEIDLHKFAGANWNLKDDDRAGATLRSAIEFADSDSLTWEWTTRDNAAPPIEKDATIQLQPAHHHTTLLDLLTGQEKARQEFYGPLYSVYFRAVTGGHFLTCVENKFRIFSSEFELLREMDSPASHACTLLQDLEGAGVSPSGGTVLISNRPRKGNQVELRDTATLMLVSSWNEDTSVPLTSISDHWQAGLCGNSWDVCIRGLDGSWKAFSFAGPEYYSPTRVLGRAYFVNDDTVLICRLNDFTVANVNGSILSRMSLPKNKSCENSVPSAAREGGRFAVMENRRLRTNEFLDVGTFWTDDELLVYDIYQRRAIFALKVKGVPPWPSSIKHNSEFALSPDGKRLAVVSDGTLRIYKLPDPP